MILCTDLIHLEGNTRVYIGGMSRDMYIIHRERDGYRTQRNLLMFVGSKDYQITYTVICVYI